MRTKEVKHIIGNEEYLYIRIFADDGKVVTKDGGKTVWKCVDSLTIDGWEEIDEPIQEDEESQEIDSEIVAKAEAFGILMGEVG